jgi:hypothetical protein
MLTTHKIIIFDKYIIVYKAHHNIYGLQIIILVIILYNIQVMEHLLIQLLI